MKNQEEKRVFVLQQVIEGKMKVGQAASLLKLTRRQVFRLKKETQTHGAGGLAHKNFGKTPSNATPPEVRERILSFAQTDYLNASCEHMAELLAEREQIQISPKTIARILKGAGIENLHTHRVARRRCSRDRRSQEGQLSQCDASPFAWLEDRGPLMSLHGSIDDATGKVQGLYFRLHEDTVGYLNLLGQVVTNFGIPEAWYSDRHTIFFSPKTDKLSVEEQLAGVQVRLTQFGEALKALHIQHIPARSPQAKGRVERLWRTLQKRLMVELRLARISTIEEANAFLPGFIQRFNKRFSVSAREPQMAYRPAPSGQELERILCQRYARSASPGSTISFEGHRYFLLDQKRKVVRLHPGGKVMILKHLDGSQSAVYQNRSYALKALMQAKPRVKASPPTPKEKTVRPVSKPASDHPWRKEFTAKARLIAQERKRIASQEALDLSAVERETYESLAGVFGINFYVRDKKGNKVQIKPKPNEP